jgi:cell wall-associated NlpC family hydrolase
MMVYKVAHNRISPLKLVALMGLPAIVLCIIVYGALKGAKSIPEKHEAIPADVPVVKPSNNKASLRDSIVDFGMGLLGTQYLEGACSKDGFDCSGFVYYVFQHFKIQVPRSSSQYKDFGKEVPIDKVKKGDILVFLSPSRNVIGHVGIVTNPKGKESDFIHSSSGREMKVIITSLKQEGYTRRFVKAVDVL